MAGVISKDFLKEAAFDLSLENREENECLGEGGWYRGGLFLKVWCFLNFECMWSRVIKNTVLRVKESGYLVSRSYISIVDFWGQITVVGTAVALTCVMTLRNVFRPF